MACDVLIVGVNSAVLQIPTFESAAHGLCRLLSNRNRQTNQNVLFQLARPVTLVCGPDATCERVETELRNLGQRCSATHNMALVAFFGGSKMDVSDSALLIECVDGFINLDNARTSLACASQVCYILDCRFAARFIDLVQHRIDDSQKVAAIASTREHAFSIILPPQGWRNMFAASLLSCPITDLEYDLDDDLQTGDLVVTLALWFESTQANLANMQSQFRRHTIIMHNPIPDSSKTPEEHFFSQHVEWYISPNFSLKETIIAHNHGKTKSNTLLVQLK